jgi:hypothetical protein
MNWEVAELTSTVDPFRWSQLSAEQRETLGGRLSGLWGATGDEEAFDSFSLDKQQALLLIVSRLRARDLWQLVKRVTNVYGEGGVGIEFTAWPALKSTLSRRTDFTPRFAKHKDTSGGFYEKGRSDAVLHFLYVEGNPRKWHVHFDLYSPVHSPGSALNHLRHEFLDRVRPDWRTIQQRLKK